MKLGAGRKRTEEGERGGRQGKWRNKGIEKKME